MLDFEWAFAGDPLYDFCLWLDADRIWPESQLRFFLGARRTSFLPDETKRLAIYQMVRNLELCVVSKLHFTAEESEEFLSVTQKQLLELEAFSGTLKV